jgi:hypothetical protein
MKPKKNPMAALMNQFKDAIKDMKPAEPSVDVAKMIQDLKETLKQPPAVTYQPPPPPQQGLRISVKHEAPLPVRMDSILNLIQCNQ